MTSEISTCHWVVTVSFHINAVWRLINVQFIKVEYWATSKATGMGDETPEHEDH